MWQVNKNFRLKGKIGPLSSSLALAFKSWWKPAFTLSLSGLLLQVCNLMGLKVSSSNKLENLTPITMLYRLQNLGLLQMDNCSILIFEVGVDGSNTAACSQIGLHDIFLVESNLDMMRHMCGNQAFMHLNNFVCQIICLPLENLVLRLYLLNLNFG